MLTLENKTNKEPNNSNLHASKPKTPIILGKGTYGLVVKVLKNGTYMARKRIQKNSNEGIDHSAVRECTFLNTLNHSFIYKPYLFNISGHGTVDIYLPLAKTDLYKWILQTHSQQRYELLPKITYQIASALSHVHKYNIIHRDVKPSNILVDDQSNFYLSDFGSSRFMNETNDENISMNNSSSSTTFTPSIPMTTSTSTSTTSLDPINQTNLHHIKKLYSIEDDIELYNNNETLTTDMITYVYRPPELQTYHYSVEADIYSLGCTLIQFIVGYFPVVQKDQNLHQIPPTSKQWSELLHKYIQSKKTEIISPWWIELLESMIDDDPKKRPDASFILQQKVLNSYSSSSDSTSDFIVTSKTTISAPTTFNSILSTPILNDVYRFIREICFHFNLSQQIYNRFMKNFYLVLNSEKVNKNIDVYYLAVACLLLVCKLTTELYPMIEDVVKITQLNDEDIIKTEVHVFSVLNFSIQW